MCYNNTRRPMSLRMYDANCRFEDDASFHYLTIPIRDHWSQSLTSYLPSAISFIGTHFTARLTVCSTHNTTPLDTTDTLRCVAAPRGTGAFEHNE